MGATRPGVFAVPAAPQAGLNNRVVGFQTLSPAKKKQTVSAPPKAPSGKVDIISPDPGKRCRSWSFRVCV